MPEFALEIELAAPPEQVWSVLTDFAAYSEWNPYQTIVGKAEPLARVTVLSRRPDGRDCPPARAGIWKFEPNARLEFISGMPLWFASIRFFHLSASPRGALLKHGARFVGVWASWRFTHGHRISRLAPVYKAFNKALVQRLANPEPSAPSTHNRRSRRRAHAKGR